jgi:hypothetical protein
LNVLDLAQQKTKLKKVSSTGGGEWQGPCPACGGTDRFHVWPEKNGGQGAYWCRGCEKSGDAIQFLRDFEGKSFREACDYLNITMEEKDYHTKESGMRRTAPVFQPATHQAPADIWQERAQKFVSWAQENLKQNKEVMAWLAARGISAAAVDKYRLGWNPGKKGKDVYRPRQTWGLPVEIIEKTGKPKKLWIPIGLVVPYCPPLAGVSQSDGGGVVLRIRIRRPDEILERIRRENPDKDPPRYYVVPGSSMATMIIGAERRVFVIVESELDAIACCEAQDIAGAIAMGSSHAKPDAETYGILKQAKQILNALDYDKAGAQAMQWWKEQLGDNCERWPVPQGKDPGEAYQLGTDLKKWIEAGLSPALTLENKVKDEDRGLKETEKECHCETSPASRGNLNTPPEILRAAPEILRATDYHPAILELHKLLHDNPAVKIINNPESLTILRNGKYVGGRINELVFRNPEVMEHILNHPDEEITYQNFFRGENS